VQSRTPLVVLALAALAGAAAAPAGAATSRLADLGALTGGSISSASAVNDAGQVVGDSGLAGPGRHAFVWQSGTMRDLGDLQAGQNFSRAYAVNRSGAVAGEALVRCTTCATGSIGRAFLGSTGGLRALKPLAAGEESAAYGVNAAGVAVGRSGERAVVWQGSGVRALGDLGGGYSEARGVNAGGLVVGWSSLASGATRGFRTTATGLAALGTLGGRNSAATAVNRSGVVVGWADTRAGATHAAAWSAGKVRDLGTIVSRPNAQALAVNDAGAVVGSAYRVDAFGDEVAERAIVCRPGQPCVDLNSLLPAGSGWVLEEADGINAQGQIVGRGTVHGLEHAFLLTP